MKHSIKSLLATLVVSLSLAAPVLAGPAEDAEAAYKRGDYATTLRLMRPLAEQGNAGAQWLIGMMYLSGQGVPKDYAKAMALLRKSGEQGFSPAQHRIGIMYEKGWGVPQDYVEAVKWYRKAAEQGLVKSQAMLSRMYLKGKGVPKDYVMAYMWMNLAAAKGGKKSEGIGELREIIARNMTPAQIAEAQRLAREWKPKK